MSSFVERLVIVPLTILIIDFVRAVVEQHGNRYVEETIALQKRVTAELADILRSRRIRVYRLVGRSNAFIAHVQVSFRGLRLVIEYDADELGRSAESFTIAHEVEHLRCGDPWRLLALRALPTGVAIAFALTIASGRDFWIGFIVVLLATAFVASTGLLAVSAVRRLFEARCDRFALDVVGAASAKVAMQRLRAYCQARRFPQRTTSDIERREGALLRGL